MNLLRKSIAEHLIDKRTLETEGECWTVKHLRITEHTPADWTILLVGEEQFVLHDGRALGRGQLEVVCLNTKKSRRDPSHSHTAATCCLRLDIVSSKFIN